jgi:hypothetical protein
LLVVVITCVAEPLAAEVALKAALALTAVIVASQKFAALAVATAVELMLTLMLLLELPGFVSVCATESS